ncbi:MAG: hypothetical protein IJS05_07780 [Paludibacteraceae bacterium]|nr:hypothetical protein [Paludibacteraceae bacterium]
MKRLVTISDRFTGGRNLLQNAGKEISKMTSEGMFGLLLDNEEDGSVIRISIDCSSATADKTICLFAGGLKTTAELAAIAGVTADIIASHGTNSTHNITVNSPNLAYYQQEVAAVPTRIKSIMVEADNATQLSFPLQVAGFGLTAQYGQDRIVLTKYKSAKNSNSLLVNVDDIAWMQLDRYKALFLTVGAGRKVDISLEVGERFNPASVLESFAAVLLGK